MFYSSIITCSENVIVLIYNLKNYKDNIIVVIHKSMTVMECLGSCAVSLMYLVVLISSVDNSCP